MSQLRFSDVSDADTFGRIPPCADPRFDHRTCDYWEDADRGSKAARPSWLTAPAPRQSSGAPSLAENPFVPDPGSDDAPFNPFAPGNLTSQLDPMAGDDLFAVPGWNPFAPAPKTDRPLREGVPRKLALLDRGRGVFGTYAKVALLDDESVAYAQFGPLSAYPRAGQLRELYPQLPDAPPPAVITCVATTEEGRHRGYARALVEEICRDLASRGFAAVEAYPDLHGAEDETSAGRPGFWQACGFRVAVDDDRYPVMRRELD